MKAIAATVLSLIVTGTQAMASGGAASTEGMSLLTTFFIAFGVLIVLFQLVPGMTLFFGMLKGIFSPESKKAAGGKSL